MLRNELIQKEMVELTVVSLARARNKSIKIKIILNIAFIHCYNIS